jgi:predicted permease
MNLQRLRLSWLDFKVGFRMLTRYPGLTIVGTVAIAVAIALGSAYFEAIHKFKNPRLPFSDAAQIVSVQHWDVNRFQPEPRSLYDFAMWRDQVKTIAELGAAVVFVRNLATEDGRIEPVPGAEISASAFAMARVAPMLGRTLMERDEQPGEPPVVLIGHQLWTARFDRDPDVLGRTVKLGTMTATIVGVMPEGFGFPDRQRVWMPLRVNGSTLAPRTGPAVTIFGRLAPGVSIDEAQAELDVIGSRMAMSHPETHERLKPRVTPYGTIILEGEGRWFGRLLEVVNGIFLLLLTIVCANVATLVFARTATRGWEIAVRNALGASRGRIVTQLFIEALVLAGIAAIVGLGLAKVVLRYGVTLLDSINGAIPFWIDDSMSATTVLYAAGLTLFGASIVGVLPALRITKVNVQEALRSESAAGAGLRFGGFWTTVIVVQVAITVAFLPIAAGGIFEANRFHQRAEGIGADRYLTARVDVDHEDHQTDSAAFAARARGSLDELERRLASEPGVEGVTFADRLPVEDQFKYAIEVDPQSGAPETGLRTSTLVHVSRGFFDAFGTSVIAGRDFGPLDYETGPASGVESPGPSAVAGHVMIVNQSFTRHVFGDRNPIGQRIRIVAGEDERVAGDTWYDIVGIVKDFGWQLPLPHEQSAMYRPRLPAPGLDAGLAMRVRDPVAFASRLRTVAADVDPMIRLTDIQPLTDVGGGEATINWTLTAVAWLVSFVVLLLSATGIHALMSFTVARRTREIGIRAALGAPPGRIVAGIFTRAFLQIGAGVLAGSGLAALLGLGSTRQLLLLLAADAVMLVVGLTASALPLRRAVRINPTEALRAEG